jgi:uncharacterized protein YjdB
MKRNHFHAVLIAFLMGLIFISCPIDEGGGFTVTSGLALNRASLALYINTETPGLDRGILFANVKPSDASDNVTWGTNNPLVAVVNQDGIVTAIGSGTAVVGVSTRFGGFSAICTVMVEDMGGGDPVFVNDVSLSTNNLLLNLADDLNNTKQLSASVVPAEATNKSVTWSINNPLVATVDQNGLVTAAGTGTAVLIVATADSGLMDVCVITVINE